MVPGELGASRVRLSSVLDQADDTEIRPISNIVLQGMLENWKTNHNDGEEPAEEEEATGDQVSALSHRIRSGGTPYVDFGVWRPHAVDLGRALKFVAFFIGPGGEFLRKELVGPSTHDDWVKSWRIYAFAMEMLGAATRTRLAKYAAYIAALDSEYPSLWWLISLADIKMRKTHMERIRRRLANEHLELTTHGLKSTFNPAMPWDAVLREAARDTEYWQKEVERKVIQFTTSQRSRPQLVDPGFGALQFSNPSGAGGGGAAPSSGEPGQKRQRRRAHQERKGGKGQAHPQVTLTPAASSGAKGKGKSKDPDFKINGKYVRDVNLNQICYAWNRAATGCEEPCRNARAHVCEICRGPHRTVNHDA